MSDNPPQKEVEEVVEEKAEEKQPKIEETVEQRMVETIGSPVEGQPKKKQYDQSQALENNNITYKFYKFSQKYNWNLNQLNLIQSLETLDLPVSDSIDDQLPFQNDIFLKVTETSFIVTGLNKHITYTVTGKDKNSTLQFTRRYTEYMLLRSKLIERWPAHFIPAIPNKTLIGNSEAQILTSRKKFINHFWRGLSALPEVFYGQQIQIFLKDQNEITVQAALNSLLPLKVEQNADRYCELYPQFAKSCNDEDFNETKNGILKEITNFEAYFVSKKSDLNLYKNQIRKLTELKTKYFKAISKFKQQLLPQYQQLLLKWFNGVSLEESSIMEKIQKKQQSEEKKEKERREEIARSLQQQSLINSQAYKSKLEDTAVQLLNYNGSIWRLYDILKFQQIDIQSVLQAFNQLKHLRKEEEYLRRNIESNKEQIEALNDKKSTLKTFFMGGTEDEKKTKLANESQGFEQKLEKTSILLNITVLLIDKQLRRYHSDRVNYYRKYLGESCAEQINIAKLTMQFHIYEYQLFTKQLQKKYGSNVENLNEGVEEVEEVEEKVEKEQENNEEPAGQEKIEEKRFSNEQ